MAFWRRQKRVPAPEPARVAGWSREEFEAVTAHEHINFFITSIDRILDWHPDLLGKETRPRVQWEIEGVVEHYVASVRIRSSIEPVFSFPERISESFENDKRPLRQWCAGYVMLDSWGSLNNAPRPFLHVYLVPRMFRSVVRALTSPDQTSSSRELKIFTVGRESWNYDAFAASIKTDEDVLDWMLPLRAAVTWTHWRFPTSPRM